MKRFACVGPRVSPTKGEPGAPLLVFLLQLHELLLLLVVEEFADLEIGLLVSALPKS